MNRRRLPLVEFAAFAAILAGGYLVISSSRATVLPAPAAKVVATPAPVPASTLIATAPIAVQAPPPALSAARAPVPLKVSRPATYWVGDAQASAAATPEGAVPTDPADKKVASDAAAKAMIEADGYKNVRALVKAPDGAWRGLAMRGAVEVAISVDANGSVSTQ
jgi:hypothetical protein